MVSVQFVSRGFYRVSVPYLHCKFYRQAKKGTRDKCRMLVNVLINLVLLVFYHGVTAAIVTS